MLFDVKSIQDLIKHGLCIGHATLGAFTRQSKNGTDPTKTGTVPTGFAKKQ